MARIGSSAVVTGLIALALAGPGVAEERYDNWHQWRGPDANGFAARGNPPVEWSEAKNVRWKVAIPGRGSATPIIWGDRLFVMTAIKQEREAESTDRAARAVVASPFRLVADEQPAAEGAASAPSAEAAPAENEQSREGRPNRRRGGFGWNIPKPTDPHQFVVMCLDRHTGKTLWQHVAAELVPHEGHHQTGSFASGSPVTDGKFVYCSFGSYGIYCYDMDGNLQWQTDLGDMKMRASFGEGASPALHGDRLVINWDNEEQSKVYVLDARTGEVVWEKDRDEASTWNTPLVTEHDGRTQVILNGANRVRSYDLATGELLWECGGQTGNPIPSPMRYGDTAICLSGFRGAAAYAIPLDASGDITDTDQVAWSHTEGTPYVSCGALIGDRLYFTKDRAAIVSCLDADTGEPIIDQKRLPAIDDIYASPVAAAGRVYITGRNGATVVLDATKDTVEVLAENELDDVIDASPAIVGDRIYLRGEKHLYCIAE